MASIKVRQATKRDIDEYERLQEERWSEENRVTHKQLLSRFKAHPQGMLVAEESGRIVGMVFAMRIADYDYDNPPSWYEITHNGMCDNHVPDGKIMFGVDLTTARGVGGRAGDPLLLGVARIAIRENVQWCMLGGRMPGYHKFEDKMTAEEYLWAKKDGKFLDHQVQYYSRVPGLRIVKALPNYFHDPDSCDYGVLLRWQNPLYNWPFPKLWGTLFPILFELEEQYLSLRRKLRFKRRPASK